MARRDARYTPERDVPLRSKARRLCAGVAFQRSDAALQPVCVYLSNRGTDCSDGCCALLARPILRQSRRCTWTCEPQPSARVAWCQARCACPCTRTAACSSPTRSLMRCAANLVRGRRLSPPALTRSPQVKAKLPDTSECILVGCAAGVRSELAIALLAREGGYENLANVEGGMNAWQGMGKPVE